MDPTTTKRIDRYFYSTTEKLGQGAFGSVYIGHDVDNKQKLYAIKVIPVAIIQTDPSLQESLMNEMQVMKLLNHPNITHCFDVLSSSNNHYFILEFCSGGTLSSYLKKRGKIPEAEALTILIQILKGYHEMLKLGIIHRDLKPDNILVHEGVFKLADFGFARCVENFSKDLLKSLVGTPLYMAPQILQQQEYSTKSDLWSIALIYYEMLFQKTPWDAKTQYDLVNKILKQPVNFPNDVKISEESKSFILGALKVEEQARLSWDEVFSHPLFNDCFGEKRRRTTLQEKAMNYQSMLKSKIIEKNIDLFKLFQIIDKNNNNQLEMNEFAELMKKLDERITREQIEFIYNTIDEDGNNSISLFEFRKWLTITTPVQNQDVNVQLNLQRNQSLPNQGGVSPPKNQGSHPGTQMNFNNGNYDNQNFITSPVSKQQQNNYPFPMPNIPPNQMQGSQGFGQISPMQGSPSPMQGSQGFGQVPPNYNQGPPQNYNQGPPQNYNQGYMNPQQNYNQPYNMSQQSPFNHSQQPPPFGYQTQPPIPYNPYGSQQQFIQPHPCGYGPDIHSSAQPGYNQYNPNFQQNPQGLNYIPMQMQGPNMQGQGKSFECLTQLRNYLHETNSKVDILFNIARGNNPGTDLDKNQFKWFLQIIKLPIINSMSDSDLDAVFWEFDLDKDGKISFFEFKRLILNI